MSHDVDTAHATPEGNLGAIRHGYEAFNRDDYDAFLSGLDPAIDWVLPDRSMYPGTHRGRDTVKQLMKSFREGFDRLHWNPEKFFVRDEQVVVFVCFASRGRGSGAEVEIRVGHLWTMRDGKAVRFQIFPERRKALEAAGIKRSGYSCPS